MTHHPAVNPRGTRQHLINPDDPRRVGNRQYRKALCSQLVHTLKDDAGRRAKAGVNRVNYSELPICIHCDYVATNRKESPPT